MSSHEQDDWERSKSLLQDFEKQIAKYVGTRHAIACSSGRSAIRYSLLALGVGRGDEVVVPDFACQVLPLTVFSTGAVSRLCDIDTDTIALSVNCLHKALRPNTKSVFFTPLYGIPVDPSPVSEITEDCSIPLIVDAAQAMGARVDGRALASFGQVGILSFTKFMNVQLGGAATTDDSELAVQIEAFRTKCESRSFPASLAGSILKTLYPTFWRSRNIMKVLFHGDRCIDEFLRIPLGRKYLERVPQPNTKIGGGFWVKPKSEVLTAWQSASLTAAMIDQLIRGEGGGRRRALEEFEILSLKRELENLEGYLEKRRRIAAIYKEGIKEVGLTKITVPRNSTPSYMRYPLVFNDENRLSRCIRNLARAGFTVDCRYMPLHMSPFSGWTNKSTNFGGSTYISDHLLPLDTSPDMDLSQVEEGVSIVNSFQSVCH